MKQTTKRPTELGWYQVWHCGYKEWEFAKLVEYPSGKTFWLRAGSNGVCAGLKLTQFVGPFPTPNGDVITDPCETDLIFTELAAADLYIRSGSHASKAAYKAAKKAREDYFAALKGKS